MTKLSKWDSVYPWAYQLWLHWGSSSQSRGRTETAGQELSGVALYGGKYRAIQLAALPGVLKLWTRNKNSLAFWFIYFRRSNDCFSGKKKNTLKSHTERPPYHRRALLRNCVGEGNSKVSKPCRHIKQGGAKFLSEYFHFTWRHSKHWKQVFEVFTK